jgi:hypothetical protein
MRLLLSGEKSLNFSGNSLNKKKSQNPTEDITNPFSRVQKPGESLGRSNSIEVLLLDKDQSKKQSKLALES